MAAMADAGVASGEGDSPDVLHSATACRMPAEGIVTHNDPVASYNSGMEIYDDLGIQALVEGMDLRAWLRGTLAIARSRREIVSGT